MYRIKMKTCVKFLNSIVAICYYFNYTRTTISTVYQEVENTRFKAYIKVVFNFFDKMKVNDLKILLFDFAFDL